MSVNVSLGKHVIHRVIEIGEGVQVQSMFGANNLKVCADIHAVEIRPPQRQCCRSIPYRRENAANVKALYLRVMWSLTRGHQTSVSFRGKLNTQDPVGGQK